MKDEASKTVMSAAPELPEDVAALYAWAGLPATKYRDFSGERRAFRAKPLQHNETSEKEATPEQVAKRQEDRND